MYAVHSLTKHAVKLKVTYWLCVGAWHSQCQGCVFADSDMGRAMQTERYIWCVFSRSQRHRGSQVYLILGRALTGALTHTRTAINKRLVCGFISASVIILNSQTHSNKSYSHTEVFSRTATKTCDFICFLKNSLDWFSNTFMCTFQCSLCCTVVTPFTEPLDIQHAGWGCLETGASLYWV